MHAHWLAKEGRSPFRVGSIFTPFIWDLFISQKPFYCFSRVILIFNQTRRTQFHHHREKQTVILEWIPVKGSRSTSLTELACSLFQCVFFFLLCVSVNNTHFPFPQQLSQLPKSTESEAGGWGGESYKEIRESLTSLGRSTGCFTRQTDGISKSLSLFSPTHTEQWGEGWVGGGGLLVLLLWECHHHHHRCLS